MTTSYGFATGIAALLALWGGPALASETTVAAAYSGAIETTGMDAEFHELFADWRAFDQGSMLGSSRSATAPSAKVSVPSRMPVEGVRLSSDYGMRTHPILGGRRAHSGIDLAGPTGTPVYATADGYVARADRFGSYGNYIQIEHGGDLQTRYAHLSGFEVAAGQRVTKGQLIGYVGSTGRSTGPHLHYEVRIAGQAVDPRPYMMAEVELALADSNAGKGGPE